MKKTSVLDFGGQDLADIHVPGTSKPDQPMGSMQRFLGKLQELVKGRLKAGFLSAQDFEEVMRQARGHAGGMARAERMRAGKGQGGTADDATDEGDGDEPEGMTEGCKLNTFKLLGEVALSEDGKSGEVQIFPAVGKYSHPRYGELNVTPDFLKTIKTNFDTKVYQQDLPLTIDLEHMSKLSGAAGWIKDLSIKGDQGMWATIEFNDRGQSLVGDKAYLYYSPEFYDEWQDPATSKGYKDVLIGGALTNRPFFKGMAPVVMATEGTLYFAEMPKDKVPDGADGEPDEDEMMAEAMTKTEAGQSFPREAYLYAPDPEKPSEWKLRIWESPTAKVTRAQLGRAAAALGKGFRGQKVELPAGEKEKALARLRSEYSKLGVKPDEMPEQMKANLTEIGLSEVDASAILVEIGLGKNAGGNAMGLTEDEAKQFAEMRDSLKSLTERLVTETESRKAAETEAKAATERVAALERDKHRRSLREFVDDHRLAFQTEPEKAVDRLETLSIKLNTEEFADYLGERKALHAQLSDSALFRQIGGTNTPPNGPDGEWNAAVRKVMAEKGVKEPEATGIVAAENPALYARYDRAMKQRALRGGE